MHLNQRTGGVEGIKVVIEEGLADDVQGELGEAGLQVQRLPCLRRHLPPTAPSPTPFLAHVTCHCLFLQSPPPLPSLGPRGAVQVSPLAVDEA